MNIWHDIDKERIYPTDFMAVVEISMGSMQTTTTRWTCCCSAPSRSCL